MWEIGCFVGFEKIESIIFGKFYNFKIFLIKIKQIMELPNIIFLIVTLVLTINLIKLIPKSILDSITTTQNFDSYLKSNFNQPLVDSQNSDQPFHVIYLILSARENFSRRKIIRETWAKEHLDQVYFLVGNYCPIHPFYRERFTCEFKKDGRFTDRINDIEKENEKFIIDSFSCGHFFNPP